MVLFVFLTWKENVLAGRNWVLFGAVVGIIVSNFIFGLRPEDPKLMNLWRFLLLVNISITFMYLLVLLTSLRSKKKPDTDEV
jgi:uncharacterized membrane protein